MSKTKIIASKVSFFFVSYLWYFIIFVLFVGRLTIFYEIELWKILFTIVLSLIPIILYQTFKKIDLDLRSERPPFLLIVVSGLLLSIILSKSYSNQILRDGVLYLIIINILAAIISCFYKISLHMILNTTVFILINYVFQWHLWIFVIIIPLIGWSRIFLEKHDVYQVISGILLPGLLALVFGYYKI